jgi:hypothetical protein
MARQDRQYTYWGTNLKVKKPGAKIEVLFTKKSNGRRIAKAWSKNPRKRSV